MTVYRKSFPKGTAELVGKIIADSKEPSVLKRAQAIYCRAAYNMAPSQIAGLTGLAESTIRRLHSDFLRFGMEVPENMMLETLPPYSPELNPSENIWDDMREKFFQNKVFDSMNAVIEQLCIAMNHYADNPKNVRSITAFPWIINTL